MEKGREPGADLFDFVRQWEDDRAEGTPRPLAEYLARFPDHAEDVAREYLRLRDEAAFRGSAPEPTEPTAGSPSGASPAEASAASRRARYTAGREIARGGMGAILRVHDETLHRDLAMKIALRRGPTALARFAEEAQITGQLEHPGVVPVHEVGVDGEGRSFFTMRLVEGRDLREIIGLVHREEEGWNLPRALEVLLKVCDTLAFAHSKGIVHRDLKPDNVRVGAFGVVHVMDWGLAKARGRPDPHDLRLRSGTTDDEAAGGAQLLGGGAMPSPLFTMDGDVVGTPSTMPPEQAAGRVDEVGPRSDVYSVGAMLYELLTGEMPYVQTQEQVSASEVLDRVLAGPPRPVDSLAPRAPAELVSICEKAMARDPAQRYVDMREMAEDLRAYLERRVVRAHRTGVTAEMRKWIARNRWLSVAIGAAGLIAVAALVAIGVLEARSRGRLQLLADARAPADLVARARDLYPAIPEKASAMERWLEDARDLVGRREAYRKEFHALQAQALPWDPHSPREEAAAKVIAERITSADKLVRYYRGEVERVEREGGLTEEGLTLEDARSKLASAEAFRDRHAAMPRDRLTWAFADPQDHLRCDSLEKLLAESEPLVDSKAGEGLISVVERRLDFARRVERETLELPASAWKEALESIRDPSQCPLYHGLSMRPQLGLVPLRRDPGSGLWEFHHPQSGEVPAVGPDGRYQLGEATGIVLVLLPGGRYEMGAQGVDPSGANYDPLAEAIESARSPKGPTTVHAILAPFFLSKYEMTRAQWRRCGGREGRAVVAEDPRSALFPIEAVDWNECMQVVRGIGLTLPSEAQWEYAARAGTSSAWWTGVDPLSLAGAANLAGNLAGFDDGFEHQAPVGSCRGNAFGIHDTCGNVSEWCLDTGHTSYDHPGDVLIDTFERRVWGEGLRIRRGGSYQEGPAAARASARVLVGPEYADTGTGLRPARELEH